MTCMYYKNRNVPIIKYALKRVEQEQKTKNYVENILDYNFYNL